MARSREETVKYSLEIKYHRKEIEKKNDWDKQVMSEHLTLLHNAIITI